MFQTTTNQYIIWWASKLGLPRGPSSRDDFHGFSLLNGYTWRYTPLTNPCNRSSPSDAAGPSGRSAWMGTTREDGALLVANAFKLLLFPGKNHFGREDVLSGIDESDVFVQRYPGICHGLHMLASSFGRGFLPNMLAPSCRLKNPAKYSSTYTFAAIRNSAQFYIYTILS